MTSDRSDKGPKGRDAIAEIARRLGSIVEAVEGAIQNGGGADGGRDFTIDTPMGPLSGRYGVTVKSSTLRSRPGQPAAGSRQPFEEPSAQPANREPMFEAFDEPDEYIVTADIPGLQLADVSANCEPGHLVLTIGGKASFTRRFAFAMLTSEHDPLLRASNGILEIRIRKNLAS
jgi:HSP20 family molecular chaperone IbpA